MFRKPPNERPSTTIPNINYDQVKETLKELIIEFPEEVQNKLADHTRAIQSQITIVNDERLSMELREKALLKIDAIGKMMYEDSKSFSYPSLAKSLSFVIHEWISTARDAFNKFNDETRNRLWLEEHTYYIRKVFKKLFNQVPSEIDDSNAVYSHIELKFNEKIDPSVFAEYFKNFKTLDYIFMGNSILINKEGYSVLRDTIEGVMNLWEMHQNHIKYEMVLSQLLNNEIENVKQFNPQTSIYIRFKNSIDKELFCWHFLIAKVSDYSIDGDELTIFNVQAFNKEIDFLYTDITQHLLKNLNEKTNSLKMF